MRLVASCLQPYHTHDDIQYNSRTSSVMCSLLYSGLPEEENKLLLVPLFNHIFSSQLDLQTCLILAQLFNSCSQVMLQLPITSLCNLTHTVGPVCYVSPLAAAQPPHNLTCICCSTGFGVNAALVIRKPTVIHTKTKISNKYK